MTNQTVNPIARTAAPDAPFRFTMEALREIHRLLEDLSSIFEARDLGGCTVEPHTDASDNHGPHWKGLRATVTVLGSTRLYVHAGLIFHPDFRCGLYLEADRRNNINAYDRLWAGTRDGSDHEVNRDEADYLKCFLPADHAFTRHALSSFVEGALRSLLTAVAPTPPIRTPRNDDSTYGFTLADLDGLYAFTQDWNAITSEAGGTVTGSKQDNYGLYFAGTRYFARTPAGRRILYPYGGVLHSRHKRGGIFLELDAWSNPDTYWDLAARFPEQPGFPLDRSNPAFLKIFLPDDAFERLMEADRAGQRAALTAFHKETLDLLFHAADDNAPP